MNRNENAFLYFLFHEGTNSRAYRLLGAHEGIDENTLPGIWFRVWAPRARNVAVAGDMNGWDIHAHPMCPVKGQGVWELFIPGVQRMSRYKYVVETGDGRLLYKADPYAFYGEEGPEGASYVYPLMERHQWKDDYWMSLQARQDPFTSPMNIYEVHLGSWMRENDVPLSYTDAAGPLISYAKKMGYTHIELLPLMEHPYNGSWGYQVCGYYAATSRYGKPEELMSLIDQAHQSGLGVIMDWVPAHFPKDAHGLIEFDGRPLYEDAHPLRMEHKSWGTRAFNYGRPEVRSFLISSALFWFEQYHIDGLRVDAVAAMLYLDYDRPEGEWERNQEGGRENREAEAFLQQLNRTVGKEYPGGLMIAEESTAWPLVTYPPEVGGLGFHFKWNMGWMNDSLFYAATPFDKRPEMHNKLTFSLIYAFSENYILPISHDEVVHGKKSLLDKMPGEYRQKFAGVRAFMTYMMTQPGKKLLFMGSEIGQFKEWNYQGAEEFFLLDYPAHWELQKFFQSLNLFYLSQPALWARDNGWDGFQWIAADDSRHCVISFRRRDLEGRELVVACNFSDQTWENYSIGVPFPGVYRTVFDSDIKKLGGDGLRETVLYYEAEDTAMHGLPFRLTLLLAPLSAVILQPDQKGEEEA